MKIVVLGVTGMLGHKMFQTLRSGFEDVGGTCLEQTSAPPYDRVDLLQDAKLHGGMDVTDFPALRAWLRRQRPEVVVNCVGLIRQRRRSRASPSTRCCRTCSPSTPPSGVAG